MIIVFKKPYGIIFERNKLYIYNYELQLAEKTLVLKETLLKEFFEEVRLYQLVDIEDILQRCSNYERSLLIKLINEYKDIYFKCIENDLKEDITNELIAYEADRIGTNYSNSIAINAQYKVMKNLKRNIESTAVIIYGLGMIGTRVINSLSSYGFNNIYIIDNNEIKQRDISYCEEYTVKELGKMRADIFERKHSKITRLKDIREIITIKTGEKHTFLHFICCQEHIKNNRILELNKQLHDMNISWTLLTTNTKELIIGPTIYPDQIGCLECGIGIELFYTSRLELMPYEADLMVSLLISDLGKIIGDMPENIVEDISITIHRMLLINRKTMDAKSYDIHPNYKCRICDKKYLVNNI